MAAVVGFAPVPCLRTSSADSTRLATARQQASNTTSRSSSRLPTASISASASTARAPVRAAAGPSPMHHHQHQQQQDQRGQGAEQQQEAQSHGSGPAQPVPRLLAKALVSAAACAALLAGPGSQVAHARLEGVNKPELLPTEFTRVIDVAGFLSAGQEQRLGADLKRLEDDTGFKLRVLAQNYPQTPGLAIRDFWGVDENTVVFVADPSLGNILNFNVGAAVDLQVPRSFWSRLAGKYGNLFYWRENGEDAAIEAAVIAIDACLREPIGPRQCAEIK